MTMIGSLMMMLATATTPADLLDRLVQRVRGTGPIEHAELAGMIGQPMRTTSATSAFRIFEADLQQLGLSVELREPVPGGTATSGPLLIVRVRTGCPSWQDILARYGPATLAQVPRGRSLDEETHFTRDEAEGVLSFGFAGKAPDCLSSVTFEGRRVAGGA